MTKTILGHFYATQKPFFLSLLGRPTPFPISTSLLYISLFSGCWNIAYGGDPLCWDWGAHAKIAVLMPRLWCSCQDCGAHAKIAVLMPRLRCSCWDWGAQVTSILAWAPQSRHEHLKLGMSTSIQAQQLPLHMRSPPPTRLPNQTKKI